jgi:tetratricopeptide (TPR) repeat protein
MNTPQTNIQRLLGYLADDPDNLAMRADIFQAALEGGAFDEAQRQVAWVLGRNPVSHAWRHRLAMLDIARGELDEAALLLQGLIDEGQDDPAIAYNRAHVDFARGALEQAVARLEPLVQAHGAALPQAAGLLVGCLHRLGRAGDAVEVFRRQVAANSPASAYGAAALAALDASEVALAMRWAERALVLDAQQHEAVVTKGTLLVGQGDVAGAMVLLAGARERHPRDGRTWSAIGTAELMAGRLAAARQALLQATQFMPEHVGTWQALGWCHVFGRDLEAALNVFETALALDRNFAESHGSVATVLAMQGRRGEAEEALRRALKLDANSLAARYAQAVLSGEADDPVRFQQLVSEALATQRGRLR